MALDLSALQRFVVEAVQRRQPLPNDAEMTARAATIAAGNARLSPVEQLDIYREQFFLRHVDALLEDFPAVGHLLGDARFEDAACAYLAAIPPTDYSLRDLGARFPLFLAEADPWRADRMLSDLARLEWAYVEAWDAEDRPALDPAKIAQMDEDAWPRARVVFHPSLSLLELGFDAATFRAAVRAGEEPGRPAESHTTCAVYMGHELLECAALEREAFALVSRLSRGVALGAACEEAVLATGADPEAFEGEIGGWFQEWTRRGWVVDLAL